MTQQVNFNPNEHLRQIKSGQVSQSYLDVKWRIAWFRSVFPQGTIETTELFDDPDKEFSTVVSVWNPDTRRSEKMTRTARGWAKYRAVVTTDQGGIATGHKTEKACNFEEYADKAETGSIGRALAALGFGTQFATELDYEGESGRIVDAPVDRTPAPAASTGNTDPEAVTEQQLASIRKLCEHLGKAEPDNAESMTYATAKELLASLSLEYRQSRNKAGAGR